MIHAPDDESMNFLEIVDLIGRRRPAMLVATARLDESISRIESNSKKPAVVCLGLPDSRSGTIIRSPHAPCLRSLYAQASS